MKRASEPTKAKLTKRSTLRRNGVSRKLIGRNLAAFMLVRVHMKEMADPERRRRVMKALRELAEDDLARFTESEIEEARRTLIAMLKK